MPGTGKSYVIAQMVLMGHLFASGHIATMAYNGIASVNIDGRTLCSALSIPTRKAFHPLSSSVLIRIRKELQIETLSLIIIDEISNIDAKTMTAIDKRLRQITGKTDLRFGGIGIVFFGDFSQLPPVQSLSLPYSAMQLNILIQQGAFAAATVPDVPPAVTQSQTSGSLRRTK